MSLKGHLSDLSLPDIFQIIHLSKKSGVLNVESPAGKGRVVFYDGQILYASLHGQERLGERLIREGLLEGKDLEAALRIQKDRKVHEPLGSILSENKFVDKDVLENLIQEQIKDVIYELLSWEEGVFRFEPEKPLPKVPPGVSVSTEYILLEGARLRDESGRVMPEGDEPPKGDEPEDKIKRPEQVIQSIKDEGGYPKVLISLIEEISIPVVSTEILLMVLRLAGELLNRAVVFKIIEDKAMGFGQAGISMSSADKRIKGMAIPLDKPSAISDAVHNKKTYKGPLCETDWNSYLVTHLGEGTPAEVFISPLIEGDRVISVVYGDNLPYKNPIGDTSSLEAFIKVAGIAHLASGHS
jgi:hypothetical protein